MKPPQPSPSANSPGAPPRNLLLPGMAAIALWMLALSVLGVVGVLTHRYPAGGTRAVVLVLSTLFATAGLGLMRKRRWGWALTLGAVFLCMIFGFYSLLHAHQGQWLIMCGVNLIFFLYLIRPNVLEALR
jgi:Predicted membrane protein (DUF2127)